MAGQSSGSSLPLSPGGFWCLLWSRIDLFLYCRARSCISATASPSHSPLEQVEQKQCQSQFGNKWWQCLQAPYVPDQQKTLHSWEIMHSCQNCFTSVDLYSDCLLCNEQFATITEVSFLEYAPGSFGLSKNIIFCQFFFLKQSRLWESQY